jgi:hypothetical protein
VCVGLGVARVPASLVAIGAASSRRRLPRATEEQHDEDCGDNGEPLSGSHFHEDEGEEQKKTV